MVEDVEPALARYGTLARAEIARWLPTADEQPWLDALVRDYPTRPGKHLRPALMLATCEAFGGRIDDALRPAAALELLHNAFLVHDDVEDASRFRRGEPTLHERYGVPLAINAGDALALAALGPLQERWPLGMRRHGRVVEELLHTARTTVAGQAIELGWRHDRVRDLTPDDYLGLILQKTCWYTTICPLRVGAIVADHDDLAPLTRFGYYLGAAFQIRDDWLNLLGGVAYGKERFGDLREGKRTLMLIHLLGVAEGEDRLFLHDYLDHDERERSDDEVARVFALMERHGSVELAEQYGRGLAAGALDAFEQAFRMASPGPARDFVHGLVHYMLARDR